MSKKDIEKKVLKLICEQMGLDQRDTKMSTSKHDMGSDSLDDIEMIMELEREFEVDLDDAAAEKIFTIQDAADLIANLYAID